MGVDRRRCVALAADGLGGVAGAQARPGTLEETGRGQHLDAEPLLAQQHAAPTWPGCGASVVRAAAMSRS